MYNPAAARTDSSGNPHSFVSMSMSNSRANKRKQDIWDINVEYRTECKLHLLLGLLQYSLLSRHLMDELKLSPMTECTYGKSGTTRSVIVGNIEYRSNAYTIYTKKLKR